MTARMCTFSIRVCQYNTSLVACSFALVIVLRATNKRNYTVLGFMRVLQEVNEFKLLEFLCLMVVHEAHRNVSKYAL